jgi:hypothetical protein
MNNMNLSLLNKILIITVFSFGNIFCSDWNPPAPYTSKLAKKSLGHLWKKLKNDQSAINEIFSTRDSSNIIANELLKLSNDNNSKKPNDDVVKTKLKTVSGSTNGSFFTELHTSANQGVIVRRVISSLISSALENGKLSSKDSTILKFLSAPKTKAHNFFEQSISTKTQLTKLCQEICLVLDLIIENIPEMKKQKEDRTKKVAAALVAAQATKSKSEEKDKAEQPA